MGVTAIGRPDRANATGQRQASSRRFNTGAVLDDTLRSRIQSGNRPHPEQLEALRSLMVGVGDPVWACGPTSGALAGFDGFHLRPPFHLLIPRGRHVNRIGHVIHTTMFLEPIDRETACQLSVTSPARTIIDLVRLDTPERVTIAIDSALRDCGTTEAHLHARIAALRSKGRHGIPDLVRIIAGSEIDRGGHSWLERRLLQLLAESGLPRPTCQEVLTKGRNRLVRVDFRFPGTPLVIEVLGYSFHRTRSQMQRDAERMNQLVLDGFVVLQFTYLHITEEPGWVIDEIRTALRRVRAGDC